VSSFQPNSLPDGYSLRLATKTDILKLLKFEYFTHEPSAGQRTISIILVCIFLYVVFFSFFPAVNWEAKLLILLTFLISMTFISFRDCLENLTIRNLYSVWIVERDSQIYGFVSCAQWGSFRMIGRLLVATDRQNMGIGSALINHCINNVETPIYLLCNPRFKNYYYRFGFVTANISNIPPELSQQQTTLTLMVLDA
jgi:GNAT superfamily N-acetyltransferase